MNYVFYISAAAACLAALLVITRAHAVHALLYLAVSLLAVAMTFFSLGAPFAAAMEAIVYAGAILVLFIFVIFLLDLRGPAARQERLLLRPAVWLGPAVLGLVLLGLWGYAVSHPAYMPPPAGETSPQHVAAAMFGPYALAVELASLLLLAALVGAVHLARTEPKEPTR